MIENQVKSRLIFVYLKSLPQPDMESIAIY
jgi:hypothetical protein